MAIVRVYTPMEVKELSHGDNLKECKTMSYDEFYAQSSIELPEKLAEKQSL